MSITIPSEVNIDGSTFYQINIKLPLRSYSLKKRYSDFETLVNQLCHNIGINSKDFPYQLPGKRINWLNKNNIIEERKIGLSQFLNQIIQDKSLQNEPEILSFLQLPKNFKFQERAKIENKDNWYETYRNLKNDLNEENNQNIVKLKERISKYYQPFMNDLIKSSSVTDKEEQTKRRNLISQLQNKIDSLLLVKPEETKKISRILGKETEETLPLNNQELLQHQIQIHQSQDKEVEQLRILIARQKQIGVTINQEVEEQNYMLDKFNGEVEDTTDKIKQARRRARKII
ncbi:uncharacterized protein KGF55_002762 [Candida pseudojiufengensis]|uniref:uncharacterized protein n=1 Tax=Candida pseudojiufengensis TaxID=497109 RepID=UPI0022250BC9|nr:uncharacterized protein KGF55_002762 [Candida pseudojiufengensis]KAI5962970.1 hypothetical protein KGF55_002762 [Candida pseudojiufengensis]